MLLSFAVCLDGPQAGAESQTVPEHTAPGDEAMTCTVGESIYLYSLQRAGVPFVPRLGAVIRRAERGEAPCEKLEEEYLALLSPDLPETARGIVYARIAQMYATAETKAPEVVVAYAREALRYPLPPDTEGRVYWWWASALERFYRDWRGPRSAVARRRIVEPLLLGLKSVLAQGAPSTRPEIPRGILINVLGEVPEWLLAQQAEASAAQQRALLLSELHTQRSTFIARCAYWYSRQPRDRDELERLATEMLGDYPEAVQEILDDFDAAVRLQGGG